MPDLAKCIPADKHDIAAINRVKTIGFPGLNPILPELLEWNQDGNWPVARPLCDLLAEADIEIVPEFVKIMNSTDESWKLFALDLASKFNQNVWDLVVSIVQEKAYGPTDSELSEEVNLIAQQTLVHQFTKLDAER